MFNKFSPNHGEPVSLVCLKCRREFIGPNPEGLPFFAGFFDKTKNAKCPECGSTRVAVNPVVKY